MQPPGRKLSSFFFWHFPSLKNVTIFIDWTVCSLAWIDALFGFSNEMGVTLEKTIFVVVFLLLFIHKRNMILSTQEFCSSHLFIRLCAYFLSSAKHTFIVFSWHCGFATAVNCKMKPQFLITKWKRGKSHFLNFSFWFLNHKHFLKFTTTLLTLTCSFSVPQPWGCLKKEKLG